MASNWQQITTQDGRQARLYPDGSIRNEKGHMIEPLPGGHTITQADARELQASAVAKKRLVMARAANREVQPELVAEYGDYAHVAERAINLQRIATSPEAGKAAVMAHDALIRDTGMSEKQTDQGGDSESGLRSVISDIAAIARAIQLPLHDTNIVDADE